MNILVVPRSVRADLQCARRRDRDDRGVIVVHLGASFVLTTDQDLELLLRFAFIPARYDADVPRRAARFPAGSARTSGPSSPTR